MTRVSLGRKRHKRERRILADQEIQLLLAELPEALRLMVVTAVSTGMRILEILALRWRAVDLARGHVRVEERYYRVTAMCPTPIVPGASYRWGTWPTDTGNSSRLLLGLMGMYSSEMAGLSMIARCCAMRSVRLPNAWVSAFPASAGIRVVGKT